MDSGNFTYDDYRLLTKEYSYGYFTENFFDKVKDRIADAIGSESELDNIENTFSDLEKFCVKYNLPSPAEYICTYKDRSQNDGGGCDAVFFEYGLLCDQTGKSGYTPELRNTMLSKIQKDLPSIITDSSKVHICIHGEQQFESYLENVDLSIRHISIYELRQRAIAIIDDVTKKDEDLILAVDGIRIVRHNRVKDCVEFGDVKYNGKLKLGYFDEYSNESIKLDLLNQIIHTMDTMSKRK